MDLKLVLMTLGNRLVTERGFVPSGPVPSELREELSRDHSTEVITMFAEYLNLHPEAQAILEDMGVEWPMPG